MAWWDSQAARWLAAAQNWGKVLNDIAVAVARAYGHFGQLGSFLSRDGVKDAADGLHMLGKVWVILVGQPLLKFGIGVGLCKFVGGSWCDGCKIHQGSPTSEMHS